MTEARIELSLEGNVTQSIFQLYNLIMSPIYLF